jgi:hypothetical protein
VRTSEKLLQSSGDQWSEIVNEALSDAVISTKIVKKLSASPQINHDLDFRFVYTLPSHLFSAEGLTMLSGVFTTKVANPDTIRIGSSDHEPVLPADSKHLVRTSQREFLKV